MGLRYIIPGGSESYQLSKHTEELVAMVSKFKSRTDCFHTPQNVDDSIKIAELIEYISIITTHLSEVNSFITCLLAQNPKDQKATSFQGQVDSVRASFEAVVQKIQRTFVNTEKSLWEALLDTDELCNYEFKLNKLRKKGQLQLLDNEEKLVADLMVDGYHAWQSLYNALISNIKVHIPINGKVNELSVGQAMTLRSHHNEDVRKESHKALEGIWTRKEELFAKILNHIAGFRLQVHKHKGIESILKEPLLDNHMKEETLNTMWRAVGKHKQSFTNYLNKKGEIFGDKKFEYYNF